MHRHAFLASARMSWSPRSARLVAGAQSFAGSDSAPRWWRPVTVAAALYSLTLASPAAATVRVVATIFPLADIVRQIGNGAVDVATLLPPGASPHSFEPTPAQM